MKRILLMVFRNILLVPYMWIKLCHRAAHPENYTLEEHVKFLKWIVFRANKGGNGKSSKRERIYVFSEPSGNV